MTSDWLLLHYKLPSQPSASRVYIWRKLQRLGAVLWQDAAWVLPDTARTREQFQWLAAEIDEHGGEASLWQAQSLLSSPQDALVQQFSEQTDARYRAILEALEPADADLALLSRQFQQAQAVDYFRSALGREVRARLLAARGGKPA